MIAVAVCSCLGAIAGLCLGITMATAYGLSDKVTTMIGNRLVHEHRAYRLTLAKVVGSTREADRLMTLYQRNEVL